MTNFWRSIPVGKDIAPNAAECRNFSGISLNGTRKGNNVKTRSRRYESYKL